VTPEEHLRSDRLAAVRLVELDFEEGWERVWMGLGVLTTSDGREWKGVGRFGEIGGLEDGAALSAQAFTVGLRRAADDNALDPSAFNAAVKAERRRDVFGRAVNIYRQVLDIDTAEPVGEPIAEAAAEMSHITTSRQGVSALAITLHCEPLWAEGHKPAHGRYTDADQRARYPGDKGLEFIAANADRVLVWPRD